MLFRSVSTLITEKYNIIDKAITDLSNQVSANAGDSNKFNVQIEFFNKIFKGVYLTVCNTLFSPKMLFVFQLNNKIIFPNGVSFQSTKEYIKNNKELFRSINKAIMNILLNILMKEAIKKLEELVLKNISKDDAEKAKLYRNQYMSLIGMSPALINLAKQIGLS